MQFPLQTRTIRPEHCDPLYLLRKLSQGCDYAALLESADRAHGVNDNSFLALGARDHVTVTNGTAEGSTYIPDGPVKDAVAIFENLIESAGGGDGLQMGYIGFLSHEAVRHFDAIDLAPHPSIPDASFFLPEVVVSMDHNKKEITLIAHQDTKENLDAIEQVVLSSPYFNDEVDRLERIPPDMPLVSQEDIEPFRQTPREQYVQMVKKAQEGILEGEVFQVVLSQELLLENGLDEQEVYGYLRALNPSPYMYYWKTPLCTIVGASPETLIRVRGRDMYYRPIAGTRKRTGDEEVDQKMQEELRADRKERCEHQMLVDLGRNDVGRVAEIGSVEVIDPFHIEQYAHVYHIVSDIHAKLAEEKTSLDALRSTFPAGTTTGAPKLRAMEVIRDLETSSRGVYGGAFGYVDLGGNLDFAITIRTMLFHEDKISIRVGAGVVADSIPEMEDNECLHKARSCLSAVLLARGHASIDSPYAS